MQPVAGDFELLEAGGAVSERGAGPMLVEVDDALRTAALQIDGPAPFRLDLDDVDGVAAEGELAIRVALAGGLSLKLFKLGRQRDALLRELRGAFRNHAVDRLRLGEAASPKLFEAEVSRAGSSGSAELRVFATRIAVIPDGSEPFAQPLGSVSAVEFDSAKYAVNFAAGEGAWSVSKLGPLTDPFQKLIESRRAELHQRASKALQLLLPSYDSLTLRRVGAQLPDSGIAKASALDAIKPGTFAALARCAAATDALSRSIVELQERAVPGESAICIAEQRDPAAESAPVETDGDEELPAPNPGLEGRSIALVFPLAGGKALAVEVGGHAGKATYVFHAGSGGKNLLGDWAQIDFKREPIYLAEDALFSGPHGSWRMALRKSEPLKRLRSAFVGRVKHDDGWSANLTKLLAKVG